MKIVADENILFVENYFKEHIIARKPGRLITKHDLQDADILLVRSITKVNSDLLQNTPIKFVGSTTSGFDHLDVGWLQKAGIQWGITKGSNKMAVVQYVIAVIAALQKMNFLLQKKPRAAVIGVGDIGEEVAKKLKLLGFDVVLYDPFRKDIVQSPIEALSDLDFMTLHVPLTKKGAHPTYHLIERNFLERQNKNSILLNASRGEVISFDDLKLHGQLLLWCLDVFENEPLIDFEILDQAMVATPHIAGYSLQSKYRGVEMIYRIALEKKIFSSSSKVNIEYPTKTISFDNKALDWQDI